MRMFNEFVGTRSAEKQLQGAGVAFKCVGVYTGIHPKVGGCSSVA
jgi:hypothetical protein